MAKTRRTKPVATENLPGGIPYIIGNEAAERFSFYGMKGILVVFMSQYLHLLTDDPNAIPVSAALAREHYHSFTAWVYGLPILGALLADFVFGKYRTILWLSIVYCVGHLCLALMGTEGLAPEQWLWLGLGLIALGSGGIKPCVSANVGDQFGTTNSHWLPRVYRWFYFSINLGAFASTLLTPWLLEWYGPHWAFGVPGVLMALATVMFWMGRDTFVHVPAGGKDFLRETFSKSGIVCMLKLSSIFIFVAVFWALFDQTGSSWVQQSEDLNRKVLGYEVLASQIQALNPIFVLLLIPVFGMVVYPAINSVFPLTPLRKIGLGLFVMIGSFAIVAMLQQWIDQGGRPSVFWQALAYLIVTAAEVMVSITALEFAYTQAPRKMKSVIMALFLMSVSLGNYFTMAVNQFIQVPNLAAVATGAHEIWYSPKTPEKKKPSDAEIQQIEKLTDYFGNPIDYETQADGSHVYRLSGPDGKSATSDDIRIVFDANGLRQGVVSSENAILIAGEKRIKDKFAANGEQLPKNEEGAALVADLKDSWGNPLLYRLVNRTGFRVTSCGADGQYMTVDDLVLGGGVSFSSKGEGAEESEVKSWLEQRSAELAEIRQGAASLSGQEAIPIPPDGRERISAGGQINLEGADYFWFFTKLMAGTALVFVFVAWLYKPQEYLQEEAE